MVELTPDKLLDALDRYPANVSSDKVYDLGHSLAAEKAQADILLTRDTEDFQLLGCKVRLEWP